MTEYIIIVAIVAIAALAVFGLFGDRIRQMVSGATESLGGTPTTVSDGDSLGQLQNLGK
jgi:Flp pilus assembly pilin Flp